jgi:hypothetical protein
MKTFEEKWTAWVDGKLAGQELVKFEASLGDKSSADVEKNQARKLGSLLKEHLGSHVLQNQEFFSHQIREAIARETVDRGRGFEKPAWWSIPRLALVGATAIIIFGLFAVFVTREPLQQPSDYTTQIINTQVDPTANPYATTTVLEAKNEKVTVLWVEGLKSLPPEYAAK